MKSRGRTVGAVLLLLSTTALVLAVSGSYCWQWGLQPQKDWEATGDVILTDRNGSRAADMVYYDRHAWARAIFEDGYDQSINVAAVCDGLRYEDPVQPDPNACGNHACMVIGESGFYVGALWHRSSDNAARYCEADPWSRSLSEDWPTKNSVSGGVTDALAVGTGCVLGDDEDQGFYTYACFRGCPPGKSDGVWFASSDGYGDYWGDYTPLLVQISSDPADQIAMSNDHVGTILVAYHYEDNGTDKIRLWKGDIYSESWTEVTGSPFVGAAQPCIASGGLTDFTVVCWVQSNGDPTQGGKVYYCSSWAGSFFSYSGPYEVGSYNSNPDFVYNAPTVAVTGTSDYRACVVVVSELRDPQGHTWLSTTDGVFAGDMDNNIIWNSSEHYMPYTANVAGQDANPCAVACSPLYDPPWCPVASCFYSAAAAGDAHRALYRLDAKYAYFNPYIQGPPIHFCGTGRDIWLDPSGAVVYAAGVRGNVHSGPVLDDNSLQPTLVGGGGLPALAVDSAGESWVALLRDDTVWCMTGTGCYQAVFAGSSSAVPGQPSIVCYPSAGGGGSAANVVFAVYDTLGGASKIMYARVAADEVILDTIESVANLRDSLPCINVYLSDSLVVTWQHGDSILSSLLGNYGPLTQGQPPAWSSPSLVTASGYHPMSVMENGCVLNCAYTAKSGSNYSVQRSTNDLAGGMFGSWTAMTSPSGSSTSDKPSSVYAGAGVSVWQEMAATGKWVIRGMARGDTMTFVANDTDAYHPHAVAESSAISPSIDQLRAYVLYTAGVTFEVDSGVYDTGVTRLFACSLNVSHAGSDATRANNGAKLVRKDGSDSLFAVYSDADGAVAYAWSAAGDSWEREIMASGREGPAIAEDSTGRRWVVVTKPFLGMGSSVQEAYYRSGSSWVGPETLYTNAVVTLGPASLAGASATGTGIAYAAFLTTSGMSKSLILAKFDGTNVSTYTVATGASLGDPSLTVEPYLADSDRVHVSWEDYGIINYRMNTDGRSTSIANNWTSVVSLSDAQVVLHHPCISADRDQIVAAWAQVVTTDIHCRKRSTDSAYNNWEAAVNLSNTAEGASDYPTIAMGDTVVVAWQELRIGGSDFDIMASIDFGDTLNIADNATFSTYPHVLFQNKVSGDTAIPYLLAIWSEEPAAQYYEVGFNKLNLKQASGEGQQSASSTPIPARPMLEACRPNPFKSHTQINYALPTASNVSLRVYDVTGRTVRTLANGHQKAGSYSVTWDSKDNRGRQVARGVYFYRLDTPGFRSVKKAVVTR